MKKTVENRSHFRKREEDFSESRKINYIDSQKGFTLIEVIIVMVLVGILAVLGGMGIVQAVKGYVTVKENSASSQKAQLAMARITREIVELNNITASNVSSTILPITNISQMDASNNIVGNRTIVFDSTSNTVKINDDILINNVSNVTFTYYAGSNTWTYGSNINLLSGIGVNMTLTGSNTLFQTIVAPRNNGNLGGATIPSFSSSNVDFSSWGSCFVATAAYGDSSHPMVQILRDFRDRYLIKVRAGRWFVNQYYMHGPAAADMIRNRPMAMFAVRCLLAPVAALVFCLMYAPAAILFVLLVSLIITCAASSCFRRGFKSGAEGLNNRGNILIGLIITMVVMAILAAAMLPMFSSSYLNQVYGDQGRKSYFLAEAGFSYAAFQFRDASTQSAKETVISSMNNVTYSLGNAGSFTLKFYPYWFKTQTAAAGSTLVTSSAGYVPTEYSSLSAGYVRVGTDSSGYSYYSYTSATGSDSNLTFYGGAFPAIAANMDVQPVVISANGSTTVTSGSDITINSVGANALPVLNGTFSIDPVPSGITSGLSFKYERRVGSTLKNITLADATKTWKNFTASTGSYIVLDKFLRIYSTGTIGTASRQVIYNVPIGWLTGGSWKKVQYLNKGTLTDLLTSSSQSMGTYSASSGAIAVSGVVDPTGMSSSTLGSWITSVVKSFLTALSALSTPGVWGVVGWDWTSTNTNLAQAWLDAGGCLSYDIQVKMKNTLPYFMTGIGFKLKSNSSNTDAYGYGVSMIRQRQTRCCIAVLGCSDWGSTVSGSCLTSNGAENVDDGINTSLRPMTSYSSAETIWTNSSGLAWQQARYSDPAIMLWQRTSSGFQILAYRTITSSDGLTYCTDGSSSCSGSTLRLSPWVTLMVRDIEGYEQSFKYGRVDSYGKHFKYGDSIMNSSGTKTARVIGTPVMNNDWGANTTSVGEGKMMLTNVVGGGFTSGDSIYISGGDGSVYAQASANTDTAKSNWIMVYYSDTSGISPADAIQADNYRIGNVVYTTETSANWPPDDWTDRSASNDYFSLVKWQNKTSSGALTLSWTLGAGWSYNSTSGALSRVRNLGSTIGPNMSSSTDWSLGDHWSYSSGIHHSYYFWDSSSTNATYTLSTTSGTSYDVSMTVDEDVALGSAYYYFGSSSSTDISSSGTYGPTTYTASSTSTTFKLKAGGWWEGTITACTVKPWLTAGTAYASLNLTAGVTYTVTVPATTFSGTLYYTIDGNTKTCTSGSVCNLSFEASTTGSATLTFYAPEPTNIFTISSVSVTPQQDVLNNTWASFVSVGDTTTDFYNAVIKTSQNVSPSGSSVTDFANNGGDLIALITSSYAPNMGSTTYYDDFAVQVDMKSGVGFLTPIQQ